MGACGGQENDLEPLQESIQEKMNPRTHWKLSLEAFPSLNSISANMIEECK